MWLKYSQKWRLVLLRKRVSVYDLCVWVSCASVVFFVCRRSVRRHATQEEAEGAARAKVVRGPTGPSFHSPLDYPRGSLRGRIRRFINHSLYLIEPRQSRALRLIAPGRFYLNARWPSPPPHSRRPNLRRSSLVLGAKNKSFEWFERGDFRAPRAQHLIDCARHFFLLVFSRISAREIFSDPTREADCI